MGYRFVARLGKRLTKAARIPKLFMAYAQAPENFI